MINALKSKQSISDLQYGSSGTYPFGGSGPRPLGGFEPHHTQSGFTQTFTWASHGLHPGWSLGTSPGASQLGFTWASHRLHPGWRRMAGWRAAGGLAFCGPGRSTFFCFEKGKCQLLMAMCVPELQSIAKTNKQVNESRISYSRNVHMYAPSNDR